MPIEDPFYYFGSAVRRRRTIQAIVNRAGAIYETVSPIAKVIGTALAVKAVVDATREAIGTPGAAGPKSAEIASRVAGQIYKIPGAGPVAKEIFGPGTTFNRVASEAYAAASAPAENVSTRIARGLIAGTEALFEGVGSAAYHDLTGPHTATAVAAAAAWTLEDAAATVAFVPHKPAN
jgi:hypothetical protein